MLTYSNLMTKFEKQFDDLEITSNYIEGAIEQSNIHTTPDDQVKSLMEEIADEHGLEFSENLVSLENVGNIDKPLYNGQKHNENQTDDTNNDVDNLVSRLEALKLQK